MFKNQSPDVLIQVCSDLSTNYPDITSTETKSTSEPASLARCQVGKLNGKTYLQHTIDQ